MLRHYLVGAATIFLVGTALAQTETTTSSAVTSDGSMTRSESSKSYQESTQTGGKRPVESYQWSEDKTTVTGPVAPPRVVERSTTTTTNVPPAVATQSTRTTTTTTGDQ